MKMILKDEMSPEFAQKRVMGNMTEETVTEPYKKVQTSAYTQVLFSTSDGIVLGSENIDAGCVK
jgi:hypothetical protein